MKVLLADDDQVVRYAMRLALTEAGHHVLEAANGRTAIERLVEHQPEVIVLDLMMPIMTGYEVLRWLDREELPARPAVIILSGFIVEPDEFARRPDVVGVLQKPLYVDDLLNALRQAEAGLVLV